MPLAKIIGSCFLAFAAFSIAAISHVSAQGIPAPASGVTAMEGSAVGEVAVPWNPVPGAQFHRVGKEALTDYNRVVETPGSDNRQETAGSVGVKNRSQSGDTITLRSSDEPYSAEVASVSQRSGTPPWTEWSELLNLNAEPCASRTGPQPPVSGDVGSDRDALVALYDAARGASWSRNDNWLSDAPLDQWHGVATDDDGRVSELTLSRNGLNGDIPPELGDLAGLDVLDLSDNQLSGEIPLELGALANLTLLDLIGNELSGEIPSELGDLVRLCELGLAGNRLSGEIPPELGNLVNLERLLLAWNLLSGEIPPELGNLTKLYGLELGLNRLTGDIPSELGGLANLVWLDLSDNRLSGEIPPELGDLANLGWLWSSDNQLRGEIPSELGKLANLKELWLDENQLFGEIPPELGSLPNLELMWLTDNRLDGGIPAELGDLTGLEDLRLDNNHLTGEIPPELGNLTNLWRLDLKGNRLSGEIPAELADLHNLTFLHLVGNWFSGCIPEGLRDVETNDLHTLSLAYCDEPAPTPTPPEPAPPVDKPPTAQVPSSTEFGEHFTASDLTDMSSGSRHTCGRRGDGTAVCWGRDWEGQSSAPEGTFAAVGAHRHYSCGARASGGIECWGASPRPIPVRFAETDDRFVSVAAGDNHVCALRDDGLVGCWGGSRYGHDGFVEPPDQRFTSIDSGHYHSCGVRTDGTVMCWGGDYQDGAVVRPGETFLFVRADWEGYSCGIRANGTVVCWSYREGDFRREFVASGTFTAMDASGGEACGIRMDGTIHCWPQHLSPGGSLRLGNPPDGSYSDITVGGGQACASRTDGTVVCWGEFPGSMPPGGYGIDELGEVYAVSAFRDADVANYVAVGENNSCQWQSGPQVSSYEICWGNPDVVVPQSGEPTYTSISAASLHTCAVATGGEAVCWGTYQPSSSSGGWFWGGSSSSKRAQPDVQRDADDPPEGEFLDIATGRQHTCGLKTDRSVVCWGSSSEGQATSPGGEFVAISAGTHHSCGLRPNGEAVCWGDLDYRGVSDGPPAGAFAFIASGDDSSCGIRAHGTVECWGGGIPSPPGEFTSYDIGVHDACGITTGMEVVCQDTGFASVYNRSWLGPMTAVSLGGRNECGIRPDGSLLCWSGNRKEIVPPGGRFASISAGWDFTCALRTNGAAVCWGNEDYGKATPPSASDDVPPQETRVPPRLTTAVPATKPAPALPLLTFPWSSQRVDTASGPCGRLCSKSFWSDGPTYESVKAELDRGADPSSPDDAGRTGLHWAVGEAGPSLEIVRLLLDYGANPNAVTHDGWTPLHSAVGEATARADIVRLLLEHGADPNAVDYGGSSVLLVAVWSSSNPDVILALIQGGSGCEPGEDTRWLHPSVGRGHGRCLRGESGRGSGIAGKWSRRHNDLPRRRIYDPSLLLHEPD